jgi:hypothetical protein
MVFHSPAQDVVDLRGDLPFSLVADPDRTYSRAFGIGRSPFFLFHRRAWNRLRLEARQGKKAQWVHGGVIGLPADFVIDASGHLLMADYGRHARRRCTVDPILVVLGDGR